MQNIRDDNVYDVFISYRHRSGFYMAQVIYERLVYSGYSVFMDKTMDSGKYEEKIHDAIRKSRNFVLVLFPGDMDEEVSWIGKEAGWALETPGINIVPVFCEDFKWPEPCPAWVEPIQPHNAVTIHKDYSLDQDLDKLCNRFLKNTNPVKQWASNVEFYRNHLANAGEEIRQVDMAFHAGMAWLRDGERNDVLKELLKRDLHLRVLVNTPEAAESIACHMRDEDINYESFHNTAAAWGKVIRRYGDRIEVRACPIPLIHVYHNIWFQSPDGSSYGRQYLKYYAYHNTRLHSAYGHELSSSSPYYTIYSEEFEYLWELSQPVRPDAPTKAEAAPAASPPAQRFGWLKSKFKK